jgi:hypothetical protein
LFTIALLPEFGNPITPSPCDRYPIEASDGLWLILVALQALFKTARVQFNEVVVVVVEVKRHTLSIDSRTWRPNFDTKASQARLKRRKLSLRNLNATCLYDRGVGSPCIVATQTPPTRKNFSRDSDKFLLALSYTSIAPNPSRHRRAVLSRSRTMKVTWLRPVMGMGEL